MKAQRGWPDVAWYSGQVMGYWLGIRVRRDSTKPKAKPEVERRHS